MTLTNNRCMVCNAPIDYEPEYCCNGRDCGCYGRPINEPLCDECDNRLATMSLEDLRRWQHSSKPCKRKPRFVNRRKQSE